MMMNHLQIQVPFVLLFLLLLAGCRQDDLAPPRQSAPGENEVYDLTFPDPVFSDGRILDTVMAIDLDANGRLEYVVTSLVGSDTVRYLPPMAEADLIQIYSFDTLSRSYRIVAEDTLEWITTLNLRDVTDDRLPDLVVSIYSGGNDIVASSGMYIYSGDGGSLRPVLRLDNGNPEFKRFRNVEGDAIVTYAQLWPDFFAHAEAVPYVEDILAYTKGTFTSVRERHRDFFRDEAAEHLASYRSVRDSIRTIVAVNDSLGSLTAPAIFTPAALAMHNYRLADALSALRSFWSSERDYLKSALPEPQYAELEQIYNSAVAQ